MINPLQFVILNPVYPVMNIFSNVETKKINIKTLSEFEKVFIHMKIMRLNVEAWGRSYTWQENMQNDVWPIILQIHLCYELTPSDPGQTTAAESSSCGFSDPRGPLSLAAASEKNKTVLLQLLQVMGQVFKVSMGGGM